MNKTNTKQKKVIVDVAVGKLTAGENIRTLNKLALLVLFIYRLSLRHLYNVIITCHCNSSSHSSPLFSNPSNPTTDIYRYYCVYVLCIMCVSVRARPRVCTYVYCRINNIKYIKARVKLIIFIQRRGGRKCDTLYRIRLSSLIEPNAIAVSICSCLRPVT